MLTYRFEGDGLIGYCVKSVMPVMFLSLSYRTAFIFSMYSMTEYGIPRTLARAVLTLPEEVIEMRTAIKQLLPMTTIESV